MVLGEDFFVRWSVDEHMCMCQLLGLSESNSRVSEALKVFLENAWRKRSGLQRGINGMQQVVYEHNYAR